MATNNLIFSSTADANLFKIDAANSRVGIGQSTPTAKLHILGVGSTSATTSFLAQDSGLSEMFKVRDDGQVTSRDGYWIGTSKILHINPNGTFLNVFGGITTGNSTMAGDNNVAFGANCFYSNTGGSQNVAVGWNTLKSNNSGYVNTAIGASALTSNTTGHSNNSVGVQAGRSNTTGFGNNYLGYLAGDANITSNENTGIGNQSLKVNTSYQNTAVGAYSLWKNTTGNSNISLGFFAGYYNTTVSNQFFLNNQDRTDYKGDITKSLIYGIFNVNVSSQYLRFNANVGINVSATALLHIAAGTATASTAPLKFNTGVLNTIAETGAMEFASDFYYLTANLVRTAISTFGRVVVNTATYTALITDRIIGVTRTATGVCTVNLPSAALYPNGYQITIMDEGLNATAFNITIDASGTQTINGNLTEIINVSKDSRTIYSNGVNAWFVM